MNKAVAGCLIFIVGFIAILVIGGRSKSDGESTSTASSFDAGAPAGFKSIVGNIVPGTKVYDRSGKFVGEIISAELNYQDPATGEKYRRIFFKYENGTVEPKKWDAVLKFDWYVK